MLSIQEMLDLTKQQRTAIEHRMDALNQFYPHKTIREMKEGDGEVRSIFDGQTPANTALLKESIRAIPLKEFLAKSGTTGLMGAAYFVPDKIYDMLFFYSQQTDHVPLISAYMAYDWVGKDLKFPVVDPESLTPIQYSGGGAIPYQEPITSQSSSITPLTYALHMGVGNDLLEDLQYDLIDWHIRQAALAFGRLGTNEALYTLLTGTGGDGTLNAEGAGADTTTKLDIQNAIEANGRDQFISNTMIVTQEVWSDTIAVSQEIAGGVAGDFWETPPIIQATPIAEGFHAKYDILDVLFNNGVRLHDSADVEGAAHTACITIVFDRNNALLTGRKRWLRVENYSHPVDDLAGAVVVGEQDSDTVYNDSICAVTET